MHLLQLAASLLAHDFFNLVKVDVIDVAVAHHLLNLTLQVVHVLKLPHKLHCLVERQRLIAHEGILLGHVVEGEHIVHL